MTAKRVVVLGAYGFIGAACVRAFKLDGYTVTGIGRSREAAIASDASIDWHICDIARAPVSEWQDVLKGADIVVNASGALQDGLRDDLKGIHEAAVTNLIEALRGSSTVLIQISAAGVADAAPTEFFRSKARGDAAIEQSDLNWIILRPVLVLGPHAYGGTALLRASAAFPGFGFSIYPNAPIQTIFVEDLAKAVVLAASGKLGTRFVADLTKGESSSFQELVAKTREWLGYKPWKLILPVPAIALRGVSRVGDGLSWLGWRSPLRTNALVSLKNGIAGNPSTWLERGGAPFRPLTETLALLPATAQERVFARAYLLLPISIGVLSLFWFLSGLIGLIGLSQAASLLTDAGFTKGFARASVVAGSVADLGLGLGVLKRAWTRWSCLGMIAVSAFYLFAATIFVPGLWGDPLGPLVKVLPSMMLALMVALMLERR